MENNITSKYYYKKDEIKLLPFRMKCRGVIAFILGAIPVLATIYAYYVRDKTFDILMILIPLASTCMAVFFWWLYAHIEMYAIKHQNEIIEVSNDSIRLYRDGIIIKELINDKTIMFSYCYYCAGTTLFSMYNSSDKSNKICFTSHLKDYETLIRSFEPQFMEDFKNY